MTDASAISPRPASAPSDDGLVADTFEDEPYETWHGSGCGCSHCFKSNLPPRIIYPALTRTPDPPSPREIARTVRKWSVRDRDLHRHASRVAKRDGRR